MINTNDADVKNKDKNKKTKIIKNNRKDTFLK